MPTLPTLSGLTPLVRDSDLISTDMDGDTVMMSIERGEYFGIGGVGPRVWALLESPTCVDAIVQVICREFDVDEATCQADMLQFASKLLEHGLIKPI